MARRGESSASLDPSLPEISLSDGGDFGGARGLYQSSARRPRRTSTQADMSGFLGDASLGDEGEPSTASAARTLKDRDQLISDLKKENFNLKLRIYHYEEQIRKIDKDGDLRVQLDLRVEVDRLQQELRDKDQLLLKAANSLDDVATSYEVPLQEEEEN